MDPAIKKVALALACALIVVIGLIVMVSGTKAKKAEVATEESKVQVIEQTAQTENTEAPTAQEPAEEAKASQEDVTQEAHSDDAAQEITMYEGALAGLSEEEIAKMAMAEEQAAARSEETGSEMAID